ncbi:CHAT domain-containing protein [Couchioplanes caeruleus]|uniref:CHAT domain-containing protein n=1 Tax=Couchioplanes caeruleus TaxID=56438 RepID=UPI0020BD91D8|nr:CHAT domain-containing protein [Couchioplanes caeruleus]UQU62695.1 CHAT domain-containing protein [Couchioplanes caeruleus]
MTDETIDNLRTRYAAAPPGSPEAALLAGALGRRLARSYFREGGTTADRDEAIVLLDESLTVPHEDPTVTHAGLGMLLFFRAMPIPVGGDTDGSAGVALGMAMMRGELNDPGRLADRDRGLGHLRWIVAHEPPDAEVRQYAEALIAAMRVLGARDLAGMIAAVASLSGSMAALGGTQGALLDVMRAHVEPSTPARLDAAHAEVLRQLPPGHRLRSFILAETGAMIAERGHVADLPNHLAGLADVVGDTIAQLGGADPDHGATVRRLAGTLLSATAYTGDPERISQAVRLAGEIVDAAPPDPVQAGKDRFLRAMTLILRARFADRPADDLRAAAADLQAALAAVPEGDDLRPVIAGMLGVLLNDRHLRRGVREDAEAAGRLLEQAGAAATGDHDRRVIELARLMSRTSLAVQHLDVAGLDEVIDGFESALAGLDAGYPWRSRFDVALGLAYLARGGAARRPDDLRTGIGLLRRAGGDLAVEESGRPALRAAAALGDLLDGSLGGGDAALRAAATRQLDEIAADPAVPSPDRIALAALAAISRLADDPRTAIDGLERVRRELSAGQAAHPLAAQVHAELAGAYRREGRLDEAVECGLDALRAYGNDVLLQSGTPHALDAARHAATLAVEVAEWCVDDDRLDPAIEALELGRGLTLHSATTGATVLELLRSAGHVALAEEWAAAPPAPIPATTAEMIAATLTTVPSDLRPRVLAALSDSGVAGRLVAVPGREEIAAAVRTVDSDALVYLLAGPGDRPGRLVVVPAEGDPRCLSAPELRWDTLPGPEPVTDSVPDRDLTPVARSVAERWAAMGDWAWPAVIAPLLGHLGEPAADRPHRLVLVPWGPLGRIPWHAARSRGRYACRPFAISYAASARQLSTVAHRPRRTTGPVSLLGDPTGDLRWAPVEVELLRAGPFPGAAVISTAEDVLRSLAGDAVLHLACHAVTGASPDLSRLVLAPDLPVTTILSAARDRPPDRPGGLVVLSACSTDLTPSAHDEALTLATAVLAAGAVSVVGSRRPVSDHATVCLMVMFHRYRSAGGLNDRDALRAAYLWMIDPRREVPPELAPLDADSPDLADPAAWAPFTHHGR